MTVLAVANQKGGVGKTTVTLGLADAAVRRGLPVLVVDLDPQANATSGLAVSRPAMTIDQALATDRRGGLADVIINSGWGSDNGSTPPVLAPSSPALAAREPQLATDPIGAQDRLRTALEGVVEDDTLVLVDCPPSLGLLTVNGLVAADSALIVTEPAAWAADGVDQMRRTVTRVRDLRRPDLTLIGIAVNRLGRTRDARYWHEQLVESFGHLALGPIRQRAAIAEASAQSLPLSALGRRSGTEDALADF
ncbi:MAG: ParA family protein, partial [Acidimicrobiales bacterium]